MVITCFHTGEKPYECDRCLVMLMYKSFFLNPTCAPTLRRSRLNVTHVEHVLPRKIIYKDTCACDRCGNPFPDTSSVKKHQQTHTGGRPFVCEMYGACFALRSNLKPHMHIHTIEKPGRRFAAMVI